MRVWKRLAVLLLVLVFGLAGVAWAHVRGHFVAARPPAEIDALLAPHDEVFRPAGPGPFPAMAFFHGCGGLRDSLREWAEQLRDQGVLVVATNSYAGRDLDWASVCGARALLGAERAGDVWVSLERVRRRPDVDPERVALMGWSHGAWAVMELLALEADERPPNLAASPGRPFHEAAGAVLLYPYCGFGTRAAGRWPHATPTLLLLAGEDSITPAEDCVGFARAQAAAGRPVSHHVYPGVDHGFDQRIPSGEWELTWNDAAGRDARRRVAAFVREHLRP